MLDAADRKPALLDLRGTAHVIGRQLGEALRADPALRSSFERIIGEDEETIRSLERELEEPPEAFKARFVEVLASESPATVDMMKGISRGSGMEFGRLVSFLVRPPLKDGARVSRAEAGRTTYGVFRHAAAELQGCSALAVRTNSDGPILAKNRDSDIRLQDLQVICRVEPDKGYRYLAVSTHCVPGVYSSGMNERGLAVADTHVCSTDVGPGLPRFALMREILEGCATAKDAVQYLRETPALGWGNLILADAEGEFAVAELGYRGKAFRTAKRLIASTNHFVSPAMAPSFVKVHPTFRQARTISRYRALVRSGDLADGHSAESIQRMLASHRDPALCFHGTRRNPLHTIGSSLYRIRDRALAYKFGPPCQGEAICVAL